MDQSCEDENRISLNDETIEICMNDVIMEGKFEENPIVQSKQVELKKWKVKN